MKTLDCILLIDDDEDCNFFHKRLIKKMQCANRVEVARNGLEGLNLIKEAKDFTIDLVLLDINMPVMDGWKFLSEYAQLPEMKRSSSVIIMLTSSINPDDELKATVQNAVSGYVNKYLDQEKLNAIINNISSS